MSIVCFDIHIDVYVRCACMVRNANDLFCAKIYNEQQIGNRISIEKIETDIERHFFFAYSAIWCEQ